MDVVRNTTWDFKIADAAAHDDSISSSIGSISEEDSMNSVTVSLSSSLSDTAEEAADSSSSSSTQSHGPLYGLSQLMNHLPIKRGLSMFYEGKAQSFTSLATVESIGDLPKKAITPYSRKRMKSSKSYAEDLDTHKVTSHISSKARISKKSSRRSLVSSLNNSTRRSFPEESRLSIAVHKNF